MAKKWNMIVDIERCNNCRGCFLAVKDEHTGNEFPGYAAEQPPMGANWLDIERKERGSYPIVDAHFKPVMCNHCDDAPCMKVAKNGAIKKRGDGIVIIDPDKAKGQKEIVDACPYGAVSWNAELELPQIWIFDAHLLDQGWDKTRIEQMCPTDVFRSVKVEDAEMQRIVESEGLETRGSKEGARPRVWYKNTHLFDKIFVSGTVVAMVDGIEECVAGAEIIVKKDGSEVGSATTDIFGEFKIDKLEPESGSYEVKISAATRSTSQNFELTDASLYLGTLEVA
jgi:Fe-S-cluster-containing dehydrogenase component